MDLQKPQPEFHAIELDMTELDAITIFSQDPSQDPQLELDAQSAVGLLPNCLNSPAIRVDDAEIDITIDIDLQKVVADPVTQMVPHSNDAEMDDAAHATVVQRRKMQPKQMIKGYRKGWVCWAAFCTRHQFTDADPVCKKKPLLFPKEDVLTMQMPKKGARSVGKLHTFSAGKESLIYHLLSILPLMPPMLAFTSEMIKASYILPLINL